MPQPLPADLSSVVEQRVAALMRERARVMLQAAALSVATFTFLDFLPGVVERQFLLSIHVVQLTTLAVAYALVGNSGSRRRTSAVLLVTVAVHAAVTGFLGWHLGDADTTPMLLTAFALLASVLLPWSAHQQAIAVAIAAVASLATIQAVHDSLAAAVTFPVVVLWISLSFSVLLVSALDRQRREALEDRLALERSEARWRELVEDLEAAVWEAELPSLALHFLSRDLEEVLGYPARGLDESIGRFLSRVHPEDRDRVRSMSAAMAEGRSYEHEYRMVAADGRSVWFHEKARVELAADGKSGRVRGITVDITALRRDQEALARRSLQIETINAATTAHLEGRPWTIATQRLLAGAVRATASECGFAAAVEDDGGLRVFAFETMGPRRDDHRGLVRAGVRLAERAGHLEAGAGSRLVFDRDVVLPWTGNDDPLGEPATFLSVPVVSGGRTVAVVGLCNRPAPYGEEQEADAVAILRTATIIHEIQTRENREAELEERRAQLAEILDASPDLVSTTDNLGRTRYTNPAGRRLLGLAPDEDVVGLRFDEFMDPEATDHLVGTVVPAAMRDGVWRGETTIRRRDGEAVPVAFVFIAHRDEQGKIRFFSSSAHDISGEKRAAEEIRALNADLGRRVAERTRQLEEAMREMEAFSYSVSHDLRAPLRRIDGLCALIAEELGDRLDENQRSYLQRVREGAQHMGALIDAQLKLSRVSRTTMRTEDVDLSAIVEKLLRDHAAAEPARAVEWSVEPGLRAVADTELVTIALDNLVANAWKYTRRCASARIEFGRVHEAGEESAPTWFVRDNGAGFDMAYAKKLFGSFQRLHSDSEFEGTGVGLATVERIVRRHGGRAWAQAAPGRGATFFFTLAPDLRETAPASADPPALPALPATRPRDTTTPASA